MQKGGDKAQGSGQDIWNSGKVKDSYMDVYIQVSLATVIGIKYESPRKGDGLKVKSFVSDEYKELIEQAARF
ncbi:hypothetical protein F3Y22_tig00110013pilonHSYRG00125 [Hibiscus syriacus]|uniref:Uncharacterized protein n=1 Tax=Hibiscus syriacus TaxID=106335 RepID=A0A6A3BP66_HIBSY|nr:hypothetical protein F3Y22_tig00110013pilonHSYRG00125 [Hibiscus syriacus]